MLNKNFAYIVLAILLIGIVSATPTLTRTLPSSVNPGQSFTVTYTATDIEKYFVAWSESITGGCTPNSYNDFMASETPGTKSITATFTAPSSGSCTFSNYGYYQFAGQGKETFPSQVITVSGSGGDEESSNTWIYIVVGVAAVLLLIVLMGGKRR